MLGKCDFSLRHYLEVLNNAKSNYNYIGPLKDLNTRKNNDSFIILRHDVDISLDHALTIAQSEYDSQLHSTFFILLHSPFYNALTKKNETIISKISSMGHEIGLHYDTDFLPKSLKNARQQIKNEARILGDITGQKIVSVTQHNPTTTTKLNPKIVAGFLDAMHNLLTKNVVYISDSVQNWRKGCMCSHVGKISKLQILTHPIWWHEAPVPLNLILKTMKNNYKLNIDSDFKSLEDLYKNYLHYVRNNSNQ